MKKILIILVVLSSITYGGGVYLEVEKETNGSYELNLPVVTSSFNFDGILYEPEIALKFTSPREDLLSANHYSVWTNHNFGYQYKMFFITNSFGLEYTFEGNDYDKDEGFEFFNVLRVGFRR